MSDLSKHEKSSRLFLSVLAAPLLVVITGLVIEYKSGYFARQDPPARSEQSVQTPIAEPVVDTDDDPELQARVARAKKTVVDLNKEK